MGGESLAHSRLGLLLSKGQQEELSMCGVQGPDPHCTSVLGIRLERWEWVQERSYQIVEKPGISCGQGGGAGMLQRWMDSAPGGE
jgi:hypothetical protein